MNSEQLKFLLAKYQIKAKQSLGQNFLISEKIIREIIESAAPDGQDCILEIGPGMGALTRYLADRADTVFAVEIDRRLVQILKQEFSDQANLHIIENDILKQDLSALLTGREQVKVVANLPYYISSQIIEKLVCELPFAQSYTLMLQKEAAERICLTENDSRYGVTAILLRLFGTAKTKLKVPAHCFYPGPKISSLVLSIENSGFFAKELEALPAGFELAQFKQFLELGFSSRRKTLLNNLKQNMENPALLIEILERLGIPRESRAEQISPEKFWQLYRTVAK